MNPTSNAMFYNKDSISNMMKNSENKSMDYIIMCNNELQTKFQALLKENQEIKEEMSGLEEEVDSLSKSRTALQGYMKNELEYALCWSNNCSVYKELFYQNTWILLAHIVIQLCVMMTIAMIPIEYETLFIRIYAPIYIVVSTGNLWNIYNAPQSLTKKDSETILKIEKANQYIMDLIDNI
jgi:hypothetical protein